GFYDNDPAGITDVRKNQCIIDGIIGQLSFKNIIAFEVGGSTFCCSRKRYVHTGDGFTVHKIGNLTPYNSVLRICSKRKKKEKSAKCFHCTEYKPTYFLRK